MTTRFGILDWAILIVYFCVLIGIGAFFARRNRSTEGFFLGNREFPAWLLGLAMFATSISSVTVVGYPADAYKTAYLRLLLTFMLPVSIFIASYVFLPFYRRARITSAFEYLESRFGPGVRVYAAFAFILNQVLRISMILYLVSIIFEQMTGQPPYVCIVFGGLLLAFYTTAGGIRAIVWTQFIQSFLLWGGALLCFVTVIRGIDGGIATVISTAWKDHKFMLGDPNPATGVLEQAPLFSLQKKAVFMMFLVGLSNFLMEYSSNQNVIQKFVAAKNPKEATRSIWICCFCSVPTWAFFMFLGTSLYVYYQQHHDTTADAILHGTGGLKPEKILPYFCVQNIPTGLSGLVIAGILAAAFSATSSSINAISAVTITDMYRRHMKLNASETHYVFAARFVSAFCALIMMGGAAFFYTMNTLTLQDIATKLASLIAGGLVGLYSLGFLTKRGNGYSAWVGILFTVLFTAYMIATEFKLITPATLQHAFGLSEWLAGKLAPPVNTYYTAFFGNIVMFVFGYGFSLFFQKQTRDLTNLTVWTRAPQTAEE